AYDAGTTIYTLDQNRQVMKPGTTMTSLPFAAEQISGFLQAVGLAKTAPKLEGLFDPKFVNDAN
ncbi:MAG: aliphatic sulfonates ABC transporter substrate-binding protein, partial [Cyanobium sp. ELA507]